MVKKVKNDELNDILLKQEIKSEVIKKIKGIQFSSLPFELKELDINNSKNFNDSDTVKQSFKKASGLSEKIHGDISEESIILINRVHDNWETRERNESEQRKVLTNKILSILKWQTWINVGLLLALGIDALEIDSSIVITYFTGYVVELIGIAVIMAKYFYNERTLEPIRIVKDVLIAMGTNNIAYIESNRGEDNNKE